MTSTSTAGAPTPEFLRDLQLRILAIEAATTALRQTIARHTAAHLPLCPKPKRRLPAEQVCDLIVDYVANYYDVDRALFFRSTRGAVHANKVAECRWQCFALCRQFTLGNTIELSAYFNCNHSTITKGGKRCQELRDIDPKFAFSYAALEREIAGALAIAASDDPIAAMDARAK